MPNFNPFGRKRRPDKPDKLRVWNADLLSVVKPLQLAPGRQATHAVEVHNYDVEDYELRVFARCKGPRLCYGQSETWTPGPVICRRSSHTAPAAKTKVHFPAVDDDDDQLDTPEQITVHLTMTLVDAAGRRFAPESTSTVHTVQLSRN